MRFRKKIRLLLYHYISIFNIVSTSIFSIPSCSSRSLERPAWGGWEEPCLLKIHAVAQHCRLLQLPLTFFCPCTPMSSGAWMAPATTRFQFCPSSKLSSFIDCLSSEFSLGPAESLGQMLLIYWAPKEGWCTCCFQSLMKRSKVWRKELLPHPPSSLARIPSH